MSATLLLGTRKGLLIFNQKNGRWSLAREAFLGAAVPYATLDARTGTLWACLDHGHWGGKLQRSRDMGETWEEVTAPKYPEDAQLKDGRPATLRYLWVLVPGRADEPQRLYIGTEPGGLFVSDDGGTTFTLVESLWNHPTRKEGWFGGGRDEPGIHSIFLDPRDRQRILVGISCAGVFETTDGGQSWRPSNQGLTAEFLPNPTAEVGHDPHLVDVCASSPDVMWQQNHCGIFRSADGSASWTKISQPGGPAHFGFAISADPDDPLTAWVVPAKADEQRVAVDRALMVCRTSDGGKTWTEFRRGLPQENCYDFVFRHGLDLRGRQMAFGTNTGGFYTSEDRGESWTPVAERLPPIYSVRFAETKA